MYVNMKRLKQNEVGISSVNYEVLSVHNLFTLNDRSRLLMKFKNIHEIDIFIYCQQMSVKCLLKIK